MPKHKSLLPLKEVVIEDIPVTQSPLAKKISKLSSDPEGAKGLAANSSTVAANGQHARRLTRKRKRSSSGDSDSDSTDTSGDFNTAAVAAVEDRTDSASENNFQSYVDKLATEWNDMYLDDQMAMGTFDAKIWLDPPPCLLNKNRFPNPQNQKDSDANSTDSESEDIESDTDFDDYDSNAEDNFRNDYPDEERFAKESDDDGGNDSDVRASVGNDDD